MVVASLVFISAVGVCRVPLMRISFKQTYRRTHDDSGACVLTPWEHHTSRYVSILQKFQSDEFIVTRSFRIIKDTRQLLVNTTKNSYSFERCSYISAQKSTRKSFLCTNAKSLKCLRQIRPEMWLVPPLSPH